MSESRWGGDPGGSASPAGDAASGTIGQLPVVVQAGEVDLAVAPRLLERLQALLQAGHSRIVVDLLDATFLDSTALGVLVNAFEQCKEAGGELYLLADDARVLKVLQITGLVHTFTVCRSHGDLAALLDAGSST